MAGGPSRLRVEGGTHNPAAPPFPFLARAFLPLLRQMGARVELTLERAGFYPAGGGRVLMEVGPAPLHAAAAARAGAVLETVACATVSALHPTIAHRVLHVLRERYGLGRDALIVEDVPNAVGSGNAVTLTFRCAHVTELFTIIGERGRNAVAVATTVADEAEAWLAHGQPVGEHLADPLLVPMSLTGGGSFRTGPLSSHTRTNLEGVARFVPLSQHLGELGGGGVEVRLG